MRPALIVRVLPAAFALGACAAFMTPANRVMAARRDAFHPRAGVRFPERAAGFVRTEIIRFDREGKDVAANYEVRGYNFTRILATLYVYPIAPEADLREEFDQRRRELEEARPATFIAEREVRLGRGGLAGRHAAYLLRYPSVLGETRQQSVLVIARWGNWWVKWRITAPDSGEDSLPPAALRLIEELTPLGDALSPAEGVEDGEELRQNGHAQALLEPAGAPDDPHPGAEPLLDGESCRTALEERPTLRVVVCEDVIRNVVEEGETRSEVREEEVARRVLGVSAATNELADLSASRLPP